MYFSRFGINFVKAKKNEVMKYLIYILILISPIFAKQFFTLPGGVWSLDGMTPTFEVPGPADTLNISHDITISGDFNLTTGMIHVTNGASVTFEDDVFFDTDAFIYIEDGSMIVEGQMTTYSMNFYNYGLVYFHQNIYNYGNIQSHGTFESHSSGRKVYNYGQFNSLIGMGGNTGSQAYKDSEVNASTPTSEVNLPVTWGGFEVNYLQDNNYNISWEVYSEANNKEFFILVSNDAVQWDTLTKISGRGNANSYYLYTLNTDAPQTYDYFKVGQVDFDGQFSIGGLVHLNYNTETIQLVGNTFQNIPDNTDLEIYDFNGKVVLSKSMEDNFYSLNNLSIFDSGIYLIQFINGTNRQVFKVQK